MKNSNENGVGTVPEQTYDLEISQCAYAEIKAVAAAHGITRMRLVAKGVYWDGVTPASLYALAVQGGEARVLDFADGPMWEEVESPTEWCDTLRQYGLGDHV